MKSAFRTIVAATFCGFLLVAAGCSKKSIGPYDTSAPGTSPEAQSFEYNTPSGGTITEEIGPSMETLDSTGSGRESNALTFGADQNSDEYKKQHGRSSPQLLPIYFDFDQAAIRGDQIPALETNAAYLKQNPSARLIVEGNCDERGTPEYNVALGERRALNAKKYLVELGIEDYRIRTVSYGEERPLFTGNDELSWSMNRRDDFKIE